MKMQTGIRVIALSAVFSSLLPHAVAAEGAHIHGEAQIAVAIEGSAVSIALNSAMYNITGFERAPKNDAERHVLTTAIARLESGDTLFQLDPAAACAQTSVSHNLSRPDESDHGHHHDHGHDHAAEHAKHGHRDLDATYTFTCEDAGKVSSLSVRMFDHFDKLEAVQAVAFVDDKQLVATLSADENQLSLVE